MGWYWAMTGGNILAIPAELAITALITLAVSRPLLRVRRRAAAALEAAHAAHRIAADTHEHVTGQRHPAAPANPESEAL